MNNYLIDNEYLAAARENAAEAWAKHDRMSTANREVPVSGVPAPLNEQPPVLRTAYDRVTTGTISATKKRGSDKARHARNAQRKPRIVLNSEECRMGGVHNFKKSGTSRSAHGGPMKKCRKCSTTRNVLPGEVVQDSYPKLERCSDTCERVFIRRTWNQLCPPCAKAKQFALREEMKRLAREATAERLAAEGPKKRATSYPKEAPCFQCKKDTWKSGARALCPECRTSNIAERVKVKAKKRWARIVAKRMAA